MASTSDANTARLDKWGRPDWAGPHSENFEQGHHGWHPGRHPGMILVMVAGFIVWWPLGLAALAYTIWSRKMGCYDHHGRWANKMERMQYKMERMRNRMGGSGFYAPSTTTARRRFSVSRLSSPNSRISSTDCVTPRTSRSSTSSWRNTSRAPRRRAISPKAKSKAKSKAEDQD